MPTLLDFIEAKVRAYKKTLEGKTAKEKDGHVSIQMAQQFNAIVDEIKKEAPEVATHLPQPILWNDMYLSGPAGVTFLELEMMLNQVLALLDVIRANH